MRAAALAALLSLSTLPLAAHAKHQGPKEAAKIHRVEKLTDNIYCIYGDGGNIGLVVTEKHAVLIDDQYERLVPGLLEAIKSVTDKPIKYLINTHYHGDHTGGNVVLEKQVAAIVAHSNVRNRMVTAQANLEPGKRGGLPELAFGWPDPKEKAYLAIHLGGTEIHLAHFGPGHTDGDVLVGIPGQKFMHLGDIFFNGFTPYIDTSAGGSLEGMLANVETVL
jgi:cyclase